METKAKHRRLINNAFYDDLKEDWYETSSHPIAFLRKENELRNPWIQKTIRRHSQDTGLSVSKILDMGCGAGFLANDLALQGYRVYGVDLSASSLEIGRQKDATKSVSYVHASATDLPFEKESFDVVCAMDFLEHIENPQQAIKEAGRVLKPGGLFFFYTFNRNLFSWLLIIKGVEWCMKNAPRQMHIYSLFIKPGEIRNFCNSQRLDVAEIVGMRPDFSKRSFWQMLIKRKVPEDFRFIFTSSLKTGYLGYAVRR